MFKLDDRLSAIMSEIGNSDVLVDVGSNHGKIPVAAALENKARLAIACDISDKSIAKAVELVRKYNVGDRVECRVGDGLEVVAPSEYDTLVIAGMGANEIISILSEARGTFRKYILSPHKNTVELREYLSRSGLSPYKDYIVKSEGWYYTILVCKVGEYKPSLTQLLYGDTYDTSAFAEFASRELGRLDKIIKSFASNCDRDGNNRYASAVLAREALLALKEKYESR